MKMMNVNEMNQQKFNVFAFLQRKKSHAGTHVCLLINNEQRKSFLECISLTICENELQMNTKILLLCTIYIFNVNLEIETYRIRMLYITLINLKINSKETQLKINLGVRWIYTISNISFFLFNQILAKTVRLDFVVIDIDRIKSSRN